MEISEEIIACVVMGRSVLEFIGCNNTTMLKVTCEMSGGTLDVDKEFAGDGSCEESEGGVAALLGDSMFH